MPPLAMLPAGQSALQEACKSAAYAPFWHLIGQVSGGISGDGICQSATTVETTVKA